MLCDEIKCIVHFEKTRKKSCDIIKTLTRKHHRCKIFCTNFIGALTDTDLY